ncbi:MAG: VOC family protein [Alphaproteobacteria bacterium]|jgi:catechol 2,3-dioxygenase-like lactoylglutathione lyase family enzyme|nr:VOC family protein [Alphaproteobacteria bacterium]
MTMNSPLWGAELDHIRLDSVAPEQLAAFYRDAFAMAEQPLDDGTMLLRGQNRRLIVGAAAGAGPAGGQPYSAFRFPDGVGLAAYKAHLTAQGVNLMPSPTPLFAPGAFAVADPDGRQMVFGLVDTDRDGQNGGGTSGHPPGRLQHVVVATADLPAMMAFYEDVLGFVATDHVLREEAGGGQTLTAAFYRSTPEHHSFAMFLSDAARPDHHAYEVSCWNDVRDWADHMAGLEIKLWWGPGRHGPGNNLFFMVEDPDGYKVEISAELESMADDDPVRQWPHNERSLNLWGPGWMRV